MNLIVIATPVAPPPPWVAGWQGSRSDVRGLPGKLYIARAPAGTPIPTPGLTRVVAPGWRPKPSARQADVVREHFERLAESGDRVHAELAQGVLGDRSKLDKETEEAVGVPHAYAWLAPLSLVTLQNAIRVALHADQQWSSLTSCGVIRPWIHPWRDGYQVWTGIGSRLERVGDAETYPGAEQLLLDASMTNRRKAAERVASILTGWSPDTPHQSARLGDLPIALRSMPLHIYRGPIAGGGSSSDLPKVATWRAGMFERHPVELGWDDARDRAALIARRAAGEARAAEVRAQKRGRP